MKLCRSVMAQGDILIIKVDAVPATAKKRDAVGGNLIVTHSESGHDHVVSPARAEMYEAADDAFIAYIRTMGDGAEIKHLRDHDTHETIALEPNSTYEIRRQREYVAEGFRAAQD